MADEEHSTPLISRQEAKALGLKKYYTGKACPKGHFSERRTSKGNCIQCTKDFYKEHRNLKKKSPSVLVLEKPILSRKEAKSKNIKTYFTGFLCSNGHLSERRTDNGCCCECGKIIGKKWKTSNPEKITTYKTTNNERDKKYAKQYHKQNRKRIGAYKNLRYTNDLNYRLTEVLRARLRVTIKNNSKSGSAVRDLGCTVEFLLQYLKDQFSPEMTWDNWGKIWEIDHIEPLCSFDLTNREQLLKAVHYTNLQPLLKKDHLEKSVKDLKKKKPYVPSDELLDLFDENPTKKD